LTFRREEAGPTLVEAVAVERIGCQGPLVGRTVAATSFLYNKKQFYDDVCITLVIVCMLKLRVCN
jgi:hypothetical protein